MRDFFPISRTVTYAEHSHVSYKRDRVSASNVIQSIVVDVVDSPTSNRGVHVKSADSIYGQG